jgi:metal-responsive CopG/Arc/MetJ family transcriptional regulator
MNNSGIDVAFSNDLLERIDKQAEKENRTRSEVLWSAMKMYIERIKEWNSLFAYGQSTGEKYGITEEVIAEEIRLYREERKAKSE